MTKKNKVFYLLPCLSVGGAERIALSLVTGFTDLSYETRLLCLKPTRPSALFLEETLANRGIKLVILGKNKRFDIKAWYRLYRLLRTEKPDILHTQLFSADICGRVIGRLAGIKNIVSTIQNLNHEEGQGRRSIRLLTRNLSKAVVAVSQTVKNHTIVWEAPPKKRLTVVYNGIDTERFKLKSNSQDTSLVIGAIGRLTSQKGFDRLIKALQLVTFPYHCYIVGEGEEAGALQALINKLGLGNKITLTGGNSDIPLLLSKIDIFVLSSRWEGLPLVLLEAGAVGLPSIVSNAPSNLEVVEDGKTGLIFETEEELKDCLVQLYKDPMLRQKLGLALHDQVLLTFSAAAMVKNYNHLYMDILANNSIKPLYENSNRQ